MAIPSVVSELVERFHSNLSEYKREEYKETRVRVEFIDPLFEALGWDMRNVGGHGEQFKEVVHEAAVTVGGKALAPDYSFRVGGDPKFFLEAKRPSVAVKGDVGPAFQLRRYAWSAKLPLSILTDFEEFATYDCRLPPRPGDKANVARAMYITYEDYGEHWNEISDLFSRDAVVAGSLDQYAIETGHRRGTAEVDAEFLREIEAWRELLARNIALRNPELSASGLNFSVQQTIDRIIFLRIAEDRGIEPYAQLLALVNGSDIYSRLGQLYRKADAKYNAGLFDFQADALTLGLRLDDKVLRSILRNLYYPQSPYEFSVLPSTVLGQVYEQFLGKVIRLTPAHRAKVEEKPEVKKAGGVYYTPTYIVEYIVSKTVGSLVAGKTPRQISRLRILDPACGSGSFLLGAYKLLLDYHLGWYEEDDPIKHSRGRKPAIYRAPGGSWRLTTAEKKRILLNNIYGVDIDRQAVGVTKLSLLLKVLEGETEETLGQQMRLWQERALPDLAANVRCGNSLIDWEYFANQDSPDEQLIRNINPFDWRSEYADILDAGGFDAVIGNPPYRRELDYKYLMDEIAQTEFGGKYRMPRMDLWYYFVHRSLELLRPSGVLGLIVNAYWISSTGAEKLIEVLKSDAHIDEIFALGKLPVFRGVSGQHMLLFVSNGASDSPTTIRLAQTASGHTAKQFVEGFGPVQSFAKEPGDLFREGKIDIQPPDEVLDKIGENRPLGDFGFTRQGIAENPSSINSKTNSRYGDRWEVGEGVFALNRKQLDHISIPDEEADLLRPYHSLSDLGRYILANPPSLTLIYSTKTTCPDVNAYPSIRAHLIRFRDIMEERRETKNGSNSWWHLHWPRDENIWKSPKVLSIQMAERPSFVPALDPVYVSFSVNAFVPFEDTGEHLHYFAALLNSRVLWKWFQHHAKRRGVGLEINGNVLARAPIRAIDFSDQKDREHHDRLVALVGQMLELHRSLTFAEIAEDRILLERQIEATDRQIDSLVYDLYSLNDAEIEQVEEATSQ